MLLLCRGSIGLVVRTASQTESLSHTVNTVQLCRASVLVQAYLMMSHDKTPPVERMYSTRGQHGYEIRKTTEGTEKHNVTSGR